MIFKLMCVLFVLVYSCCFLVFVGDGFLMFWFYFRLFGCRVVSFPVVVSTLDSF